MNAKDKNTWGTLTPADADCLDQALASRTADGRFLSLSSRPKLQDDERARNVLALLELIGRCPADEPPHDLTQRTISAVTSARQRQRFQQQVRTLAGAPQRFSLLDIAAVAAIIVAAVSLMWPALSNARSDARRLACANNLSAAGAALGAYATDNNGQMPRYANQTGTPWYQVGAQAQTGDNAGPIRSNSAQLYILVRRGYVNPAALACPENPNASRHLSPQFFDWPNADAVSYSYQNQYTSQPVLLDQVPEMAVLADKNPLFVIPAPKPGQTLHLIFRRDLSPTSASRLHGTGQNILRADGAVQWSRQPMVGSDNIWLVDGVGQYEGKESPAPGDSHLVP